MIETIAVLERLCFIAEKAGIFRFNLQRILADFINNVQLVTEFSTYRRDILKQFDTVFAAVAAMAGDPEIYIVAHSEGTVVTLAGLLAAMKASPPPAWLPRVRGVMTIGSPLDTHIVLWPELWRRALPKDPEGSPPVRWKPPQPIPWHNYFDRGDPIADRLQMTDAWLTETTTATCSGSRTIPSAGTTSRARPTWTTGPTSTCSDTSSRRC